MAKSKDKESPPAAGDKPEDKPADKPKKEAKPERCHKCWARPCECKPKKEKN